MAKVSHYKISQIARELLKTRNAKYEEMKCLMEDMISKEIIKTHTPEVIVFWKEHPELILLQGGVSLNSVKLKSDNSGEFNSCYSYLQVKAPRISDSLLQSVLRKSTFRSDLDELNLKAHQYRKTTESMYQRIIRQLKKIGTTAGIKREFPEAYEVLLEKFPAKTVKKEDPKPDEKVAALRKELFATD